MALWELNEIKSFFRIFKDEKTFCENIYLMAILYSHIYIHIFTSSDMILDYRIYFWGKHWIYNALTYLISQLSMNSVIKLPLFLTSKKQEDTCKRMWNWQPYWISKLLGGMGEKKLRIPVWILSTYHIAHEISEYLELTFWAGLAK